MTKTMNTPGVYITETDAPSLSVPAGATSVPIFAAATNEIPGSAQERETAQRYSSWIDFSARVKAIDYGNVLHASLRAYFDNGGGYCYVIANPRLAELALELDDATLLVAAGQSEDSDFRSAVSTLCKEGNGLFAIVDVAKDQELTTPATAVQFGSNMYAAAYYPWLTAQWAGSTAAAKAGTPEAPANAGAGKLVDIPPSAVMAGVYCSVDRQRGVWKAPANVPIRGNLQARYKVTDAIQGAYNIDGEPAVNVIREMSGVGLTVWGARTLATDGNWRYVPVRRLFNSVQRDIRRAMSFAIFEPNTQPTWERVRAAIDSYLRSIWLEGGLMGDTEQQAYFVQIGKSLTMTAQDIDAGKMIVKVGIAAVRPAEFIELRFTQNMGELAEPAAA